MKILLLSLSFLFGTGVMNSEISSSESKIIYDKVTTSKIKVKVTTNTGDPIGNVLVKIMQDKRHLGETFTDENGMASINCKYVADNNKNVEIIALKDGYKDVSIKGNLITSITNFEFFLYKNDCKEKKPNTMNFTFQQEELRSPF